MTSTHQAEFSLAELVGCLGGELVSDTGVIVRQVATLARAQADHISFFTDSRYRSQLRITHAGAVILGAAERDATPLPRIVVDNPAVYLARVVALLNPPVLPQAGIHPSAAVDPSARIDRSVAIGAFVQIGKNVRLGQCVVIRDGCSVGDDVHIGDGSVLYPRVTIYPGCVIGDRVILHAGTVIGADGFGLAQEEGQWIKIPQIGGVVIGNDVEIGANTTVDRGALDDTVIEEGVKLDNLIQVAHNVRIGAHTAIAGCVGIAGSAKIGRHCTIGGAAGILGHLDIADHVHISAKTLVTKSISQPGIYTANMPFAPHKVWLRSAAHLRHLDRMAERLRQLERKINELKKD